MSATTPTAGPADVSASSDHRVAIVTLGCGRNEVDSDQLAGLFHREGVEVIDDPADADVVLVNTCTFIAPAKQESVDTVLEACDLKGPDGSARAVLVVGCMAERYPEELADAIPEADAIVGFDGYGRLPQLVDDVLSGRPYERVPTRTAAPAGRPGLPVLSLTPTAADPAVDGADTVVPPLDPDLALGLQVEELPREAAPATRATHLQDELDRVPATGPRFPVRRHDGRPWAYLKLASGCDRLCTFCAIPSFRGRFRSRPLDELRAEASWLVDNGARELVLVSENTTSWGKDLAGSGPASRGAAQAEMVEVLAATEGLERLRLMYLQPAELTNQLLEVIAAHPKVASYFDLSLQHVSGPVVRRMARSGDHERFGALVERIRELDPHATFRSNFILGFPGETEADVEVLEDFLSAHRLDWVGLFAYSPEGGTPAADLPDQVPAEVAAERVARVSELQERLAEEAAASHVGRVLDVTVEEQLVVDGELELTAGRTVREAPDTDGETALVDVDGRPVDVPVGRTVPARVVDHHGVDLVAIPEVGGSTAALGHEATRG